MNKQRKRRRIEAGRKLAAKKSSRLLGIPCDVSIVTAQPGEDGKPKTPTLHIEAYNGDTMKPDYIHYPTPVVVDLEGLRASEPVTVLFEHDTSKVIGQSTNVSITTGVNGGVVVDGIVTGDIDDKSDPASKVVGHAGRGFKWRASMGVDSQHFEKVESGDVVNVNGREFSGPLYVLRSGVMDEVSLLPIAADRTSSAKIAATAAGKDLNMEFHDWLKAEGFDPSDLDDKQRDSLLTSFKAKEKETAQQETLKAAPKKEDDAKLKSFDLNDDRYAAIKARNKRNETIRLSAMKFAHDHPELVEDVEKMEAAAIADETNPESFDNKLFRLKGEQPLATNYRHSSDLDNADDNQSVFEAALCITGGMVKPEKHFKERILEAADKRWKGTGLGLGELLVHAAKRNGDYEGYGHKDVGRLLTAAFSQVSLRAAGPSTFDVAGILANVANKFLVDYFSSVESVWRLVAAIRSVNDFKSVASHSLIGDYTYEPIAPGGEIPHGVEGETDYANQAATYGRMFAIDRRDIINDDLGAFTTITRRLGRGGAIKLNEVFWTEFLDNAAFFVGTNSNYATGAATHLDIEALAQFETLFMKQTDPSGKPMGNLPTVLLVPPELKRAAMQLMNSMEVRFQDTSTAAQFGTTNTFMGAYQVAATPYLSNSSFTGYSVLAWYLIANPADIATIEVAFLNGVERPTVDSAQADFNQLGIQLRGYFDFGVAKQEYRGGVKSKGEG